MKRVLMLWQSDYPWDVRMDKMVRSFVSRGHRVTVLANNSKNLPLEGEYFGARVIRLSCYRLPIPASPYWIRGIEQAVREERPDLIMVRDLPLFHVGYWVACKRDIPVWFDMAEDYPAMFLDMPRSWVERLTTKNYWLARVYERFAVHRSAVITVVCEESKERVTKLGVPGSRIQVIKNTPDRYFVSRFTKPARGFGTFTLVYHGNLGIKRGLHIVIDALALQQQRRPHQDAQLVIAGGIPKEIEELRLYALARLRRPAVTFLGTVPYLELANLISQADWGIIPHLPVSHVRSTMPNKIYDYMAVGTPVIVSDVGPLRRVVEETGAGVVFRAGDPESLSQVLSRVMEHPELRLTMSARASEAYERRFNWETDEVNLLRILDMIS